MCYRIPLPWLLSFCTPPRWAFCAYMHKLPISIYHRRYVDNRYMKRWKKITPRVDASRKTYCFECHGTATHTPTPLFFSINTTFLHFSKKKIHYRCVCVATSGRFSCIYIIFEATGVRVLYLWKVLWDFDTLSTVFIDITKTFIISCNTDKLMTRTEKLHRNTDYNNTFTEPAEF